MNISNFTDKKVEKRYIFIFFLIAIILLPVE